MSDLIDRQRALDAFDYWVKSPMVGYSNGLVRLHEMLEEIPSAKPEQKVGHWTREEHPDAMPTFTVTWRCSICGKDQSYGEPPFCPNCGALMERQA